MVVSPEIPMLGALTVKGLDTPQLIVTQNSKTLAPQCLSQTGVPHKQLLLLHSTLQCQQLWHHQLHPMLLQIINPKLVVSPSKHAIVTQPPILTHGSSIPLVQNT